ncbi:MAG: hypothetical protein K2H18_01010 [Muribaculaceae bacterium]|nr:hypothetical protein [Muribaculaceae bacterium]
MINKSRRDAHIERMRKKYPDKKFEDDEEIFGTISDDYDQYEQDNRTMREENDAMRGREKTLSDMFAADPRAAYFMNDWREGGDPVMGLVRRFGTEVKDILDDPAMQDKIEAANKEYLDRVAKSKELDAEYESNMDATLETLRKYQEQEGVSDEDIDNICAAWLQIVRDGVMGKLTTETITLISNALNHDTDVADAREEGEVKGKNSRIVEKMRKQKMGDGTMPLSGRNNSGGGDQKPKSVFDLAREWQDS